MDKPFVRLIAGLAAGSAVVFLLDRLVWPGTLSAGLVGVVAAVGTLAFTSRRA